jgi:hypothetical protein
MILDFGMAVIAEATARWASRLTLRGQLQGTLMSPRLATVYLSSFVVPLWAMDPRLESVRTLFSPAIVPVQSED